VRKVTHDDTRRINIGGPRVNETGADEYSSIREMGEYSFDHPVAGTDHRPGFQAGRWGSAAWLGKGNETSAARPRRGRTMNR